MSVGKIFKFHNDLDTDQIIASQYLLLPTIDEMKDHTFESLDPDFPKKVKPGDYVVGGENFGCGSSREQAPEVVKALGVRAFFLQRVDGPGENCYRVRVDRVSDSRFERTVLLGFLDRDESEAPTVSRTDDEMKYLHQHLFCPADRSLHHPPKDLLTVPRTKCLL